MEFVDYYIISKTKCLLISRFLAVATAITDSALESVSGQKQNAKVEPGCVWAVFSIQLKKRV